MKEWLLCGRAKCLFSPLIILLFFPFSFLQAQWNLEVKNLRSKQNNTRMYLGFQTDEFKDRNFVADISIRPLKFEANAVQKKIEIRFNPSDKKGSLIEKKQFVGDFSLDPTAVAPIYLRKEVELFCQGNKVFVLDFKLPENQQFQIDVDILNKENGEHVLLELDEPYFVHNRIRLQTSDLFLSFRGTEASLLKRPVLDKVIDVDQPSIHYGMYLYAKDYEVLRIRAILAKEQLQEAQGSTLVYESIQQTNRVVNPGGRQQFLFRDTLDLSSLEPSTYTIWVLVEAGGDEKLERVSFVKGGDISKKIYGQLYRSIEMMTYILPDQTVSKLLDTDPGPALKTEFNKTWEKLYGEEAQTEMQLYYEKVFHADSMYKENEDEGWKTDRGKIFVLYGQPREEMVSIRGQEYLRWIYPRWALSFLFREEKGGWTLVE